MENEKTRFEALFAWSVDKCYCKDNPFAGIKTKREAEKKRIMVPPDDRKRITEYCREKNEGLLLVCQLVYSALIRPKEIRLIKVSDVNLAGHYIHIRGEVAKTHYSRIATMNPELEAVVSAWIANAKKDDYLIGRDYKACAVPQSNSRFIKDWAKMREELRLPEEMQLYSLRDSSMNEMLKAGIDYLTVLQHADHHDLSITTRYANHVDPNLVATICGKAPRF